MFYHICSSPWFSRIKQYILFNISIGGGGGHPKHLVGIFEGHAILLGGGGTHEFVVLFYV